jgi:hypothetical protein
MSASTPGADLIKAWAETQQRLLATWLEMVRGAGGTPGTAVWSKTVEAWQSSVQQTLDAQQEWFRLWAETLTTAKGSPEELQERARQGQEVLQRWSDAQRQLWQGWFDIVRKAGGDGAGGGAWPGQGAAQPWQETARKMIDAQAEFARRWMAGFTGA